MKIKPRILPRDFLDVLIGFTVGLFVFSVLCIVPSFIVAMLINLLAGAITYLFLGVVYSLFAVRSVMLDEDGILFHRVLGFPKQLPWKSIISIEEVPRQEVVYRGWLWPLFPSREMTPTLSAKHHFRISWADGFCYFPPKDVEQFKIAISKMMKNNPTSRIQSTRYSSP